MPKPKSGSADRPSKRDAVEKRRGRRPDPVKREAILAAATDVFLERGYAPASMEVIAERAGVSKRTLYKHGESKDALFAAIIQRTSDDVVAPILSEQLRLGEPDKALTALAREFMRLVLSERMLALHRLMISEQARLPHLAKAYYESGLGSAIRILAAYLREKHETGLLQVPEPELAAEQFFAMVSGNASLRLVLGLPTSFSRSELGGYLEQAVRTFLDGCRSTGVGRQRRTKR